jgi:hypothetical protein
VATTTVTGGRLALRRSAAVVLVLGSRLVADPGSVSAWLIDGFEVPASPEPSAQNAASVAAARRWVLMVTDLLRRWWWTGEPGEDRCGGR